MTKSSIEFQQYAPDSLATNIVSLWTQWHTGKQLWLSRVREVIQFVYATSTRETTNAKNPWSHSTVIPKLTQIHDNLGANYSSALFGRRDFFTFEPASIDEASKTKRTAIVNYLSTKHDYSGWNSVMLRLLNDWVQTGNCFAQVEYVREVEVDANGLEVVQYEGPKVSRISPYDICFDPTVSEFKDSPKIIRSLVSRGELFRRAAGLEGKDYDTTTVEKLRSFYTLLSASRDGDINKNIQMTMDGFSCASDYFRSGKVELLEFVGDIYDSSTGELHQQQLITVVDRRFVLRHKPLDDYQGFGKIYHSGWRKRTDNLWAQGPLDNLVGMQYLINHLENARADGFDQMLSPDRVHVGNVEIEQDGPVTNYYIDDVGGSVQNLAPDSSVLTADNQIAMKEAQMEAYAGAPREAMGVRSPGEKTAFEVQRLESAAGRIFQVKIDDFEREMVEPLLNGELELAVRNLQTSDIAKVLDDDEGVVEFLTITKDDLTAKGKLKARGASHYAKRAQLVQELQQFSIILMQDQSLSVHFPAKARAKAWSSALGFDRLQLYSPFGQVAENLEGQQMLSVARSELDAFEAAGLSVVSPIADNQTASFRGVDVSTTQE